MKSGDILYEYNSNDHRKHSICDCAYEKTNVLFKHLCDLILNLISGQLWFDKCLNVQEAFISVLSRKYKNNKNK